MVTVAIGGLAPPKGVARVIYSHMPLLLGTNRHIAEMTGFEPILTDSKSVTLTVELHPNMASILDRTPRPAHSFFIKQRIIALSLLLGLTELNHHSPVQSRTYYRCTKSQRLPFL